MQQQISVITLGIEDLSRSRRFYTAGFGWIPVFENDEIIFYQMNGFVLGTFLTGSLATDMQREGLLRPGAFALAHNVLAKEDVVPLMDRLMQAGGVVLQSRGRAIPRRLPWLCRRSRRSCLGDRLEPDMDDRRSGTGHFPDLTIG